MHYELPIGAFTAAFLALVPLPWHWRARNVPTLSIILWLFFSNLIYGVNTIVWAGRFDPIIPVWCDITTKFEIGATMALPACCLCLCIHLERIASVRQVQTSIEQKRRRMIFDVCMCWGLPVITMVLHYVVQGHRFDIVQDFGCRPAIYVSLASIFLVWAPPLIVVFLTLVYATLALVHFFRRRITFARHLAAASSLTPSRYFRLMAMALVQMLWGTLVMTLNVYFTCRAGLRPWVSWDDVHSNFGRVGMFPSAFIPAEQLSWTFFLWWTIPITSVIFFAFFSFGQDAMREYAACINWVRRVVFRQQVSAAGSKPGSSANMPSFVRPPPQKLPAFKTFDTTATSDSKSDYNATSTSKSDFDHSYGAQSEFDPSPSYEHDTEHDAMPATPTKRLTLSDCGSFPMTPLSDASFPGSDVTFVNPRRAPAPVSRFSVDAEAEAPRFESHDAARARYSPEPVVRDLA